MLAFSSAVVLLLLFSFVVVVGSSVAFLVPFFTRLPIKYNSNHGVTSNFTQYPTGTWHENLYTVGR